MQSNSVTCPQWCHGWRAWVLFGALAMLYIWMVFAYDLHHADDAWTLSFHYYFLRDGFQFDKIFGDGYGVLAFFGKTQAYLYGLWAQLVGWERIGMRMLSVPLVWLGAFFWSRVAWHFTHRKDTAYAVFVLCLLFDAFISTATKTRPDALAYMLGSLAVYLACRRQWLLSIVAVCIAVETHVAGITHFFFVLSVFFSNKKNLHYHEIRKAFVQAAIGGLLGIAYYLALHYQYLQDIGDVFNRAASNTYYDRFYLVSYFFYNKENWRIPLFVVFALAYGAFYWKGGNKKTENWRFLHYASMSLIAVSFVLTRGNPAYAVHVYPVLVLVLVYCWQKLGAQTGYLVMLIAVITLPQYVYTGVVNRHFRFADYIEKIREAKTTPGIYLGHPTHWFAFYDDEVNSFYAESNDFAAIRDSEFIWIQDSKWSYWNSFPSPTLYTLSSACPMQIVANFSYAQHEVKFIRYDCRIDTLKQQETARKNRLKSRLQNLQ